MSSSGLLSCSSTLVSSFILVGGSSNLNSGTFSFSSVLFKGMNCFLSVLLSLFKSKFISFFSSLIILSIFGSLFIDSFLSSLIMLSAFFSSFIISLSFFSSLTSSFFAKFISFN